MAGELTKLKSAVAQYWNDCRFMRQQPNLEHILELIDEFEWIYFGDEKNGI